MDYSARHLERSADHRLARSAKISRGNARRTYFSSLASFGETGVEVFEVALEYLPPTLNPVL